MDIPQLAALRHIGCGGGALSLGPAGWLAFFNRVNHPEALFYGGGHQLSPLSAQVCVQLRVPATRTTALELALLLIPD